MVETRSDAWITLAAMPFVIWLEESVCLMLLNISLAQMALGHLANGFVHLAYIGGVFFAVMGVLTNTPLTRRLMCVGLLGCYAWWVMSP